MTTTFTPDVVQATPTSVVVRGPRVSLAARNPAISSASPTSRNAGLPGLAWSVVDPVSRIPTI